LALSKINKQAIIKKKIAILLWTINVKCISNETHRQKNINYTTNLNLKGELCRALNKKQC